MARHAIPGTIQGYRYERAWFRRSINIPEDWHGSRILIHFGGVKYNSTILVNGIKVGGSYNGYDAFDVDITDSVTYGEMNELLVGVYDWTGVIAGPPIDFPETDPMKLLQIPKHRIMSPVGGLFDWYGIWNSVTLRVVSKVYIKDIFIRPNVTDNRLDVDITVINTGDQIFSAPLQARIFGWYSAGKDSTGQWSLQGEPVASFPVTPVSMGPDETLSLTISLDDPPLETWSPYDPNLYVLELGFAQSNGDAVRVRMGYRQLTVNDGDFYLNGEKIHMLATSWWPTPEGNSREYVETKLREIRAMNTITFRTHTQPWQDIWYEVADKVGLMMIPEGAMSVFGNPYAMEDPAFWLNYKDHLLSMVSALRNHPSVVMWSLENELFSGQLQPNGLPAEGYLAEMGLAVKEADPTRPITYEADGDPGHVADVLGLHYPREFPRYRNWPQDAYWMDAPFTVTGFWDNQPLLWDHRKPLYIGEYLWAPSVDPAPQTIFLGDDAYRRFSTYRTLAKAEVWSMQILAYRHYEVSGQSPWTAVEAGNLDESNPLWVVQRDMYQPLAAFLQEYDAHFYAGETVLRTIELFNDTMQAQPNVQFHWSLLTGNSELANGGETLAMPSGDHQERRIALEMPSVSERTRLTLLLTIETTSGEHFRQEYALDIFPRPSTWSLPPVQISLYDPSYSLTETWVNLDVTLLERVEEWNGDGILVLAPHALSGANIGLRDILIDRVNSGGRILALEQDVAASAVLPVNLSDQTSSITFLQVPSHPILDGFLPTDFRWWRGDLGVSVNESIRPSIGGALPLVVSGSASGINNVPLLEIRQGNGAWLICQLQVVSKLGSEPIARLMFDKMLDYLAGFEPTTGTVFISDESNQIVPLARTLELDWRPFDQKWEILLHPLVDTLVIHGGNTELPINITKVHDFLESGGTLLLDQPDESTLEMFLQEWNLNITGQPYQGVTLKVSTGNGIVYDLLAREDLYWLSNYSATTAETPFASNMSSTVFMPVVDAPQTEMIKLAGQVSLQGEGAEIKDGDVFFYGNDHASWDATLPNSESGLYLLTFRGWGSPADGIYPKAAVWLDNQMAGYLSFSSNDFADYSVWIQTNPGEHQLGIEFTNDYFDPPEDRNLNISSYSITPLNGSQEIYLYTTPTSLIEIPIGKGRLIINTIEWNQEDVNSQKARRFFSSLLTGLGTRWKPGASPIILEAESMTPQPGILDFTQKADHVVLAGNGYLQGTISIPESGIYQVDLVGKGTPVDEQYPIVQIGLDGVKIGQLEINSDSWAIHATEIPLFAGEHRLRLMFINDDWSPITGEDRNLWIDQVRFYLIQ